MYIAIRPVPAAYIAQEKSENIYVNSPANQCNFTGFL
jgi:hypothetical protein